MIRTALSDQMDEVVGAVRRLREQFAPTAPQPWDAATAAAELTVQIGHTALCLSRRSGANLGTLEDPRRPITSLGDELADIVLATVSITVLSGAEPAELSQGSKPDHELDAFLLLLVASGRLAEAALIEQGYRHRPAGETVLVSEACAAVLAACEALADHLGLDLVHEFWAMVADADAFLDQHGGTP